MPKPPSELRSFESIKSVVQSLRGPDGCPWDKEQTHSTLTRYALEEAYELADAIDHGTDADLREELGDCLLQVVLHSEIARQEGRFDVHDVIETLNSKMIRRHPHVFGDVVASTSEQVMKNWAEIKASEKAPTPSDRPLTHGLPQALPAMQVAHKLGERSSKVGFDWDGPDACWAKVQEEIQELKTAIASNHEIEEELGDVLFSVVQLARHLKVDSEQALRKANHRIEARFLRARNAAEAAGRQWTSLTDAEKESYWRGAK